MKKIQGILLFVILIAGFVVRLYRFNNPVVDWHSWRQADTSAVSRNFVTSGFDILHPHFDDLSNVPSGLDNPQGYRFVEFPIYNVLQAAGYKFVGHITLEEWGRLLTIIASLFSLLFIYLLMKKYAGNVAAIGSALFWAFDPYNIYYSRVILPDPSMVTATLGAIYFYDKTLDEKHKGKQILLFIVAVLFGMASLLLKPYAIFFLLPVVVISFYKWNIKTALQPFFWLFFILSAIPLAWWRVWMLQYPAGIPASTWLFNGGNIRFTGAYFYWIFADRLSRLILGYWGIALLCFGFLSKKNWLFFASWIVSSLAYVVIIARGNVQHDYYQILIIPSLAVFVGLGVQFLINLSKDVANKWVVYGVIALCSIFALTFGWYSVRDYFNINNPSIVIAGQKADRVLPKDAKVITFYDGDTSFLYQTKRKGWSSLEKSLPEMITMGAQYIVIANPTQNDFSGFGKQFKVVAASQQYLIVDLTKKQ